MSRGNVTTQDEFGILFDELLSTRSRYESLRMSGGPFGERASMLDRLHSIRHNMDLARRNIM